MHHERISNVTGQMQELEGRNTALQLTIDRLNDSLGKKEEGESHLKDRVRL